jgi:hypothetical protein
MLGGFYKKQQRSGSTIRDTPLQGGLVTDYPTLNIVDAGNLLELRKELRHPSCMIPYGCAPFQLVLQHPHHQGLAHVEVNLTGTIPQDDLEEDWVIQGIIDGSTVNKMWLNGMLYDDDAFYHGVIHGSFNNPDRTGWVKPGYLVLPRP